MHAHACAAGYVLGPADTTACPAGSAKITDTTPCQAAAKALAKTYGGWSVSQDLHPGGCLLLLGSTTQVVYYNPNANGAAAPDAQPLCLGTGAPFQPPPPHTLRVLWAEYPLEQYCGSARAVVPTAE
jgi:hypothetical protein